MFVFWLSLAIALVILLFLPIKKAVKIDDVPSIRDKYFICEQQSITGPNLRDIGDVDGMFSVDRCFSVLIEGIDPQEKLTNVLQIDAVNRYIIYGNIVSTANFYGAEYPVITSSNFDILYPIDRGNSLRFFVPKSKEEGYTWEHGV